MNAVVMDFTKE